MFTLNVAQSAAVPQTEMVADEAVRCKIENLIPPSAKLELSSGKAKGVSIKVAGWPVWIPKSFLHGERIEEIGIVNDIDLTARMGTSGKNARFHPPVEEKLHTLIKTGKVFVGMVSGSPVMNDQTLEECRRGNFPFEGDLGPSFAYAIHDRMVEIYGCFGGQRINDKGKGEALDEYSLPCSFELTRTLIRVFLNVVVQKGDPGKQAVAKELLGKLSEVTLGDGLHPTNATADEFMPILKRIVTEIDSKFRCINNGPSVAVKCPNFLKKEEISLEMIKQEMNRSSCLKSLVDEEKRASCGDERKDDVKYTYVVVSKTNKDATTRKLITRIRAKLPQALIISFGDGKDDFQMQKYADIGVHVGSFAVFAANQLPQSIMVRGQDGKDEQFVNGTAESLQRLIEAFGKSFYDFHYIQRQDPTGKWQYYSLRELLLAQTTKKENFADHFERVQRYFSNFEFASIMTGGVSAKGLSNLSQNDLLGGLWEGNWAWNVLTRAVSDPTQEASTISLFLKMICELKDKPTSFFVLPVDSGEENGKKCHPIWVRLLATLVTEAESAEFADKLSPGTKAMIQEAASRFNEGDYGVATRIAQQKGRKKDFNELFSEPGYKELRDVLLQKSGEFSPKHCAQLILGVEDRAERNKLLKQYIQALKLHPSNTLAKQLLEQLKIDFERDLPLLDADVIAMI